MGMCARRSGRRRRVLHLRARHDHGQRKSPGINLDVSLSANDSFALAVPALPHLFGGSDRFAVDAGIGFLAVRQMAARRNTFHRTCWTPSSRQRLKSSSTLLLGGSSRGRESH